MTKYLPSHFVQRFLAVATLAASPLALNAQTSRTWVGTTPNGDTGNWSDTAKWSGANVPDTSTENAVFGVYDNARTVTVNDQLYTINKLTITPRTSGFSGRGFTLNSVNGGSLAIGAGGVDIDNGNTAAISVGIEVTADQTWSGLTSNPGGNATFSGVVSGVGKITRSATFGSQFDFTNTNTFSGGFTNNSQTTRFAISTTAALTGGGLGTGTVTLNGGTLASNGSTARTLHNNVLIGGNVTIGQASGGTGAVTFTSATAPTTFNLNSASNGIVRSLTINSAVTVNQGIGESGGGTGLGLTKLGSSTLTLNGDNTFTGDTTVSAGAITYGGASSQIFKITDVPADATQILGTGTANFNGAFRLDLSSVTNFNNAWTLVTTDTLTETFGVGFTIVDGAGNYVFTENANVWSASFDGNTLQFAESTGILTAVPEPAPGLLGVAVLGMLVIMRRRRQG